MYPKQPIVAMLLAGGHGSRLGVLTKKTAKPAMPFGGKYRIIDFPLSNCINSGIDAVGVLTQYQPLVLNEYIGNGQPWDLDNINSGVQVLSPYQQINSSQWYSGTANAIYQNMNFIDRYDPDYVIVLSGDHIYKMDYSKMIEYHKNKKADCTIASIDVPLCEASRFGILNTNDDGSIYEFEEKPEFPKSTKASMGIYVFNADKLKKYLKSDNDKENSDHDFGKNVLPDMLKNGEKLFAYEFNGYWKDVGTIESLWEANMDLLDPKIKLNLSDENNKIYSRNPVLPPHYVDGNAKIQNSIVADGCSVYGKVEFSVIFSGVYIGKDAVVTDSILMPGVVVGKGSVVQYSIIAENTVIGENCVIGERPENLKNPEDFGISVVGDSLNIANHTVIKAKETVDCDNINVLSAIKKLNSDEYSQNFDVQVTPKKKVTFSPSLTTRSNKSQKTAVSSKDTAKARAIAAQHDVPSFTQKTEVNDIE